MPIFHAPHGPIAWEQQGEGTPLVLITGLGSQLIRWSASFRSALVDRGFRLILLDNRDAGLSRHYPEAESPDVRALVAQLRAGECPSLPYTLADLAGDVRTLLDGLEIGSAHVLGVSMGGFIAQHLASRFPDRVRSLTLIMTASGNPDLPGPSRAAQEMLSRRSTGGNDREALIEQGLVNQRAIGSPGYPSDEAALRIRVAAEFDRAYDPSGYARQRAAILADGDRRPLLGSIRAPTLVIHGLADPLVDPEGGRELAALIEGATLVLLRGMGHEIPEPLVDTIGDAIMHVAARTGEAA